MIIIDNDYMINEKALDVRSILKKKHNESNIAEIFFKQLSYKIYDYVINNNVKYKSRYAIDIFLNTEEKVDNFKRALSDQAVYMFSVGDTNLMLPDESARWIGLDGWFKLSMCQQTVDTLKQMGLLMKVGAI